MFPPSLQAGAEKRSPGGTGKSGHESKALAGGMRPNYSDFVFFAMLVAWDAINQVSQSVDFTRCPSPTVGLGGQAAGGFAEERGTMQLLELTLDDPYQNIALDEALLEANEQGQAGAEVLRLWHPDQRLVVVGRSSSLSREVNLDYCEREQIPVVRRCSGGASIVTGKGCLMYAVLLSYRKRPHLRMLEQAHRFVMSTIQAAIGSLGIQVEFQGTSDLTINNRKFSGNALRCKKDWLLYHGTLLYDMNLDWISACLGQPARQPDYRADRTHAEFVGQIPVSGNDLCRALIQQWGAREPLEAWPRGLTKSLADEKYACSQWNQKVE